MPMFPATGASMNYSFDRTATSGMQNLALGIKIPASAAEGKKQNERGGGVLRHAQ
jgi:hypothetical protein